jgi:hypothetical protein
MINDPKFHYRFDGGTRYPYNYFNNREFRMGYDAHSLGEPLDNTKSQEWIMGWHEWENDMNRSENQSYY